MTTTVRCACGADVEIEYEVERGDYKPIIITEEPITCGCGAVLDVYTEVSISAAGDAADAAELMEDR